MAAAALRGLICGLLAFAAPAAAQEAPGAAGRVVERVRAATDTSLSYALFLPPGYRPTEPRPLLIVMDPRGRAQLALELFRPAAAQYRWIVMSSYNTASDRQDAPNVEAVNAMLTDAQQSVPADMKRLYFAGFSGTARQSWDFARQLQGSVAGIIGVGGGLPQLQAWTDSMLGATSFGFFGLAGTRDFNHDEMRFLDARLERLGVRRRLEVFDGEHQWAPEHLVGQAIEWFELDAMRQGGLAADTGWIRRQRDARVARADSLTASGRLAEAQRAYMAIAADFQPWRLGDSARARAAALGRSREVRKAFDREAQLIETAAEYLLGMRRLFVRIRLAKTPEPAVELQKSFSIDSLKRAAQAPDSLARTSAVRLLETVYTYAAGYEPDAYMAAGRRAHALAMLDLAELIKPATSFVCVQRARATGADSAGVAAACRR
ncbi:MAG: hypothetical protein HOP28_01935 [Gemmatimonadales bacterium]|nr:hypothetical protein [Gemmatimonadales bacterium]